MIHTLENSLVIRSSHMSH